MRTPSAWTIPVVLFVLAAPMSPFAPALQAQARPLSASDMFTIETASDPQISPDGLWVAYVRNWSDAITD
ncbi:MAG: hypothetical protein KBF56_00590, partial [Gemmatimonadaceae bacterium]|nr:hypothetical protein [Gemmatimonadaceae bacterium]